MLEFALLLVTQPVAAGGSAGEQPIDPCAPRHYITRGGPPSPIYHLEWRRASARERFYLLVHGCQEREVLRVERMRDPAGDTSDDKRDWVTTRHCPGVARWARRIAQVELPAPMLAPPEDSPEASGGDGYTIRGWTRSDQLGIYLDLDVREPAGAPPNALSEWIAEGEREFQRCRDAGHGSTKWLPPVRPGLR